MTDPVCPKTGASMRRGVRPMTLEYKGANLTFDMPGWYCEKSDESIHTGEDMKVSDRALNRLKAVDKLVDENSFLVAQQRRHAGAFDLYRLIQENNDDHRQYQGNGQIARPSPNFARGKGMVRGRSNGGLCVALTHS